MSTLTIAVLVDIVWIFLVLLRYFKFETAGKLDFSAERKKHMGSMMTNIIAATLLLCVFVIVYEYFVPRNSCTDKKVETIIPTETEKKKPDAIVDSSTAKPVAPDTTHSTNKKTDPKVEPKPKKGTGPKVNPKPKAVVKKKLCPCPSEVATNTRTRIWRNKKTSRN
jgi:hypothetical protein